MERPLASKRPIGPFAQSAHGPAEVNVYFSMSNLAPSTVGEVDQAIDGLANFKGPASGIHGVQDNVVSLQTIGNQTTHSNLMELMEEVKKETGIDVEDVEVIW